MPLERDGEFILERFHLKTYTVDQLRKMMDVVPEGTSASRFQEVLGSSLITALFHPDAQIANRLAVQQALGLGPFLQEPGSHIVDYSMSLEQMIVACKCDWNDEKINAKRFPIVGQYKVEFEDTLFHFNRKISSEDVVKEILAADTKNPWQPGKIENILAYGAKNPEEQRKYPIVGLGSVCDEFDGGHRVSCLGKDTLERSLFLCWWERKWDAFFRFHAVRKKVSQASAS